MQEKKHIYTKLVQINANLLAIMTQWCIIGQITTSTMCCAYQTSFNLNSIFSSKIYVFIDLQV